MSSKIEIPEIHIPQDATLLFSLDGDGVLWKAAVHPLVTRVKLNLARTPFAQYELPAVDERPREYKPPTNPLKKAWAHHQKDSHERREPVRTALSGLESLQRVAKLYDRESRFILTTGRTQDLHGLTRRKVVEHGYDRFMDTEKDLFLNMGRGSARFKEGVTGDFMDTGRYFVIHIDDDWEAAACVGRNNARFSQPRGIVFLISNSSNTEELLTGAGVTRPDTIIPVEDIPHASKVLCSLLAKAA